MKYSRVTIEKIINGGYGLAHLPSHKVVLVREVLPGECVIVTPREGKKNYLFGKVVEFEETHPNRVVPPCKYYSACGGCDLQHCTYDLQLEIKRNILIDLLLRQQSDIVKKTADKTAIPLASPSVFNYRQRIRLQVGPNNVLGFNRHHSHDIVTIKSCLLAENQINNTLKVLRINEDAKALTNLSSEVELLSNPATAQCVCIFKFTRKPRSSDINRANRLCRNTRLIEKIFISGKDFQMLGPFHAESDSPQRFLSFTHSIMGEKTNFVQLSWEAGAFCQVNLQQNAQLIDTVLSFAKAEKDDTILDLYCGMGNFSIPLAFQAKEVCGIESQGSAIRSAEKNALAAGLSNTSFHKKQVHISCSTLVEHGDRFDCVIIDPPRQGAPDLAPYLAKLSKKRLVYISCDPATLCRDLKSLCNSGFSIITIQPVDMFPQTHHVETVVLLEK